MAGIQLGLIGSLYGAVGDYESIQTVTVGSGGSTTITFSSIPSTYTHLQVRMFAKDNVSTADWNPMSIQFNGDTGSNYASHDIRAFADGSNYADNTTTQTTAKFGQLTANVSNHFGITIMDILDYANTNKYKTVRSLVGAEVNTALYGFVGLWSSLWQSTSAITSMDIKAPGRTFAQYSHFALYGLK